MVSPGEGYRLLAAGEVIREGDEYSVTPCVGMDTTGWRSTEAAGHTAGSQIATGPGAVQAYRRPVRLQSPGWRYLDEGETAKEGDQWLTSKQPELCYWRTLEGCACEVREAWIEYYRRRWPETSVVPQQVPTESNEPEPAAESEPHEDPLIQQTLRLFSDGCFVPPPLSRLETPNLTLPRDDACVTCGKRLRNYYMTKSTAENEPKYCSAACMLPEPVMCGCGHHAIQPGEDPYAAHRTWLEFKHEYGHVNDRASASVMWRVQGVGVSATKMEVGFQLQGEAAEDI